MVRMIRPLPATPAWPPRSAPRLFVTAPLAVGDTRVIDGNAAHYLATVMRVGAGDAVILCDDVTGEYAARVTDVTRRAVTMDVIDLLRGRDLVPDLWLCIAPIKKPHLDLVIEKATELGVDHVVPVLTRRCVVDKINAARLTTIATEAAEQCARTALPTIMPLVRLAALLDTWPDGRLLFFADEMGGAPAAAAFAANRGPAAVLVGPEGGFDDAERAMISALPFARPIALGPRILRAETAAIAAVSVWMASAGDW